jgi:hypothetical protein
MPAWQRQWNDVCQRMGVQPRQFAILLAVLALGVGGLLVKSAFGPRAASASAAPIRKAPEAPAPVAKAETAIASNAATKQEPGTSRRVVEMAFERAPSRDPFKPWNAPAPVNETAPAKALVRLDATPGVLPGLPLKAVVRGELAVFGDQTVRVGDAVGLPDGTFARIKAIGDRTVTVDHDGQLIDVQFGAGIAGKAPAAGGFR